MMDVLKYLPIIVVYFILELMSIDCAVIRVPESSTGILGQNVHVIECQYDQTPGEIFRNIEWQMKQNNRYEQLAMAYLNQEGQLKTMISTNDQNFAFTPKLVNENEITFRMTFISIMCQNERTYRCRAQYDNRDNKTLTLSDSTKLSVQARPEVPVINYNPDIMEFDNVIYTCTGRVGRPAGEFIWRTSIQGSNLINTLPGTLITQTENSCVITRVERLILPLTRRNSSMIVSCIIDQILVDSDSPPAASVGPFDVKYPPDQPNITKVPNLDTVDVGLEMLTLRCSVDSNPVSTFTWTFNGVPAGNSSDLTLQNLDKADGGNYTCYATNTIGENSLSVAFQVEDAVIDPGELTGTGSESWPTIIVAVLVTSAVWVLLTIVAVVVYKKGICRGKIRKRKLKDIIDPASSSNNVNRSSNKQKSERDRAPFAGMYAVPDDYLVPDELNVQQRTNSTISHPYENTKGIRRKPTPMLDHNGYMLSQTTGETENYYDEILRKNTVKSTTSNINFDDDHHDYMVPI